MIKNRYGEFICPECGDVFHDRKKLSGHIGGAHRRCITERGLPRCKVCKQRLTEGANWPEWAVKQRNLICKTCKNVQNKTSYRNRVVQRATTLRTKLDKTKIDDKPSMTLDEIKRRMGRG